MLRCPGYCGRTFNADDDRANFSALCIHLAQCPPGNAAVALLTQFAAWIDDGGLLREPVNVDFEWSNNRMLYKAMAYRFLSGTPLTEEPDEEDIDYPPLRPV